jgi:hypothetical protein
MSYFLDQSAGKMIDSSWRAIRELVPEAKISLRMIRLQFPALCRLFAVRTDSAGKPLFRMELNG